MIDVVIIGGGIAGLTAALDLQRSGREVLLIESESDLGGNIRTFARGEFRMERGPHSFMGSAEHVWRLIDDLGIQDQVEEAAAVAANRYIFRQGALYPLPISAGTFLCSGLLSFGAKLRLAMEPFARAGGSPSDTAWDFFTRRFGKEATSWIMSPFISGIYAGDIHALGARAAFPKFWHFEQESGSMIRGAMSYMKAKKRRLAAEGKELHKGLFTIYRGLGGLTATAAMRLERQILINTPVQAISPGPDCVRVAWASGSVDSRAVVLAAPPHRAAAILSEAAPAASAALEEIPVVPVVVVHWSPRNEEAGPWPEGFGALIPHQEGLRLLGTLFPSQLFEGRAPPGRRLFTSFYGGALDPEITTLSDDEFAALVRGDHGTIFGFDVGDIDAVKVVRYEHAIPQLMPGHPEAVARLGEAVRSIPGLFMAGNYLTGVGIENATESGYTAAEKAMRWLDSGPEDTQ